MPPHLPTKRLREEGEDESPAHAPPAKRGRVTPASKSAPLKKAAAKTTQSLAEALDVPSNGVKTIADRRRLQKEEAGEESSGSSEEDSSGDSDDFEDVPGTANRLSHGKKHHAVAEDEQSDGSDEMEFEDVEHSHHHRTKHRHHQQHHIQDDLDESIGDISIELSAPGATATPDGNLSFTDARGIVGRKGPSKIERQIRQNTHCMHVQFLMFHNTIRNAWCQDKEVQDILVNQLPPALQKEVTRWNKAIGGGKQKKKGVTVEEGIVVVKGKGKAGNNQKKQPKQTNADESALQDFIPTRNEYDDQALRDRIRDWGADAEPLERDKPDLSHGDPTIRLLRHLAAYWKKRFLITAPSLHKRGYLELRELEKEVNGWKDSADDPERFGERIQTRADFRQAAKKCEGSRDIGAQLFTALLRGIGVQARMVVSLQPVGFGFGKVENGEPYKKTSAKSKTKGKDHAAFTPSALNKGTIDMKKRVRLLEQTTKKKPASTRKSARGSTTAAPISLDTESSDDLSDAPSEVSGDSSIVDVTASRKPSKAYAAPPIPTYWTEVPSPITHTFIPVVSLPQPVIANSADLLTSFTPSGKEAEKAKQVLAYIVAYNADGTAKDVTVRYLKKKLWPGKTRGVRVQKEKLPIYNKRGKVKKWIEYDWFAEVMHGYARDPRLRDRAEKYEDEVDLVPIAATKREEDAAEGKGNVAGRPESLQAYKNSADYVLERHLRREEAILPSAKVVRHFTTGKAENAKAEPVYRRSDIVTGMTVESWHKQGRAVKEGEQPIKMVPIRAVTLIRKREVEDAARETGEKPMQGLYSEAQTDWIIPDPIGDDRRIPKNAFGNIDVYVASMVPRGAVHVRLKGCAKLCRKLGIDFSGAVTGFEFGKQRAVPVITGVVVAEEHEGIVKDAWRAEQQRVKEREAAKKKVAVLAMWKKMLSGLRVIERMGAEYGHLQKSEAALQADEVNPWMNKKARQQAKTKKAEQLANGQTQEARVSAAVEEDDVELMDNGFDDADVGGGFIPEGMVIEEVKPRKVMQDRIVITEEEGGGFMADGDGESDLPDLGDRQSASKASTRAPTSQNGTAGQEGYGNGVAQINGAIEIDEDAFATKSATNSSPSVKKRNRPGKAASAKQAGLSKRVAEARQFDDGENSHLNSDVNDEPETASESYTKPQKKRRSSGRTAKTDAGGETKATRATPKRKAVKNVRSRYFESDASVTD